MADAVMLDVQDSLGDGRGNYNPAWASWNSVGINIV